MKIGVSASFPHVEVIELFFRKIELVGCVHRFGMLQCHQTREFLIPLWRLRIGARRNTGLEKKGGCATHLVKIEDDVRLPLMK